MRTLYLAALSPAATILALTADGRLYLGTQRTDPTKRSTLTATPIYLKVDARTPFQKLLPVLEALRAKSVVLLTAPPAKIIPPYGVPLRN